MGANNTCALNSGTRKKLIEAQQVVSRIITP